LRLSIICIGRLKDDAERVLVDRYAKRLTSGKGLGPLTEKELIEGRASSSADRRSDEATRLLKAAENCDLIVALDERGTSLSSLDFAQWLGKRRDTGTRHAAFLIGGPDGHGDAIATVAQLMVSIGPFTLTHGLARAVLAEQLYRASTILQGHPYHRA
jgi:23S rRNA (pseudouridine1915-N3)-methyltransferase